MTKSKSTFPAQSKKRNSDNNISQSNVLLKLSKNDLNCHNTLPKLYNISNFESIVEKYNEKINLWQNYYLYVKQNYLYLYDKKPKTSEKPKEYLYLNNKITATFHRRLFKLRAIKNYVVNIKINNEALSKSLIEDNKHNIYLSFKSQINYIKFRKIVDDVITSVNSSNIIQNETKKEKIKKYKSYRHLKNKSESNIQLSNNLINKTKEENEEINSINNKKNNNSVNKNNNSFNKSIKNVFTFSKIDNTNTNTKDKNNINSNSSKRSNSCNTNNRKNINNLIIEEKNEIFSLKPEENNNNINIISNSKQSINYFNVNFNENNLKIKYNEDDSCFSNNNNIFDPDFSLNSLNLNCSKDINKRPYTSLVYSIRRKKEKEKEDENKIKIRLKKHRTKSCYKFKVNNIFLQNNEKKEENKIKTIKIKLKDYNSSSNNRLSLNENINISDYSRDEKNMSVSLMNNTGIKESLNNYSFNDIEEKNSENKSSKSKEKEKENDKTKNNTNSKSDISLNSLKSFKEESKEKLQKKEIKQNTNFEGMDIYSYMDASDMTKNKSNSEDNNQMLFLDIIKNNENISKIRSQISQIIKQKEEMMSKNNIKDNTCDEFDTNEKEDESDTNIIFTSRLRKEMTENNSNNKEENNNENNNINETTKIDVTNNNERCSNIMNISNNTHCRNHLRFSSDLNDLIQTLEKGNKSENNYIYENDNKISIPINSFYKNEISFDFLDTNFDFIINDKNKNIMKNLINKIDNNEIFIYDSSICDLLITKIKESLNNMNSLLDPKGIISKNKILGKIYELSNNKYVKYFLLCEMISIISKKELSKIIINAIEVYNKKKEINKNEKNVNYDEYIYNIYNKYLSRNENNKEYRELYENILPKKIKEFFNIKDNEGSLINIIKNEIHPNTLFNSMQYHNKILFYNINIENEAFPNFNLINPLNNQYKYYISPYLSEKWKFKASKNSDISNNNNGNINVDDNCEIKKEKEKLKQIKMPEKFEKSQMFNLFNVIISNINQNELNLALKNCDYFIEKYKTSISFIHSLIYLCISFIYNRSSNFELSENYFNKSSIYLNWLFPNNNNFLFFEFEYKHLSILLNNEENIIIKNMENIETIFETCDKMWNKFYFNSDNNELKMDNIIFKIYFKINCEKKNDVKYLDNVYYNNIRPLIKESEIKLKKRKHLINLFIKLLIEFFNNCPGCHITILNDLIRCFSTY